MAKIILFNKPYQVLCQFTDAEQRATLAQYINIPNIYPAGRLDRDSEGLLLLTDDGRLQQQITHPRYKLPKTYWAQVEGSPCHHAMEKLRNGVVLKDGPTQPAEIQLLSPPPELWPRQPPIRQRQNIPTHWLEITLHEGRNRQVRRMTASVGLPTLRLVRVRIGPWHLDNLAPGQWQISPIPAPEHPSRAAKQKPRHRIYKTR